MMHAWKTSLTMQIDWAPPNERVLVARDILSLPSRVVRANETSKFD